MPGAGLQSERQAASFSPGQQTQPSAVQGHPPIIKAQYTHTPAPQVVVIVQLPQGLLVPPVGALDSEGQHAR